MHVQPVGWSSGPIPLSSAAQSNLEEQRKEKESVGFTLSGISRDGTFGWQAFGSVIEVFKLTDGQRLSAWCFGAVLREPNTVITCITECSYKNERFLVVATVAPTTQSSLVCLLDIASSKIQAIELAYKVTSMEMVSSINCQQPTSRVLSQQLKVFCGILAVGTHCGHIYLIDLCLDRHGCNGSEVEPIKVHLLDPHCQNVNRLRKQVIRERCTLAMELGAGSHSHGSYVYQKPDDSHMKTFSEDDVEISSLHFLKHTGQLAVGFSFGAFQLWRLSVPVLEYSSRLEEESAPVTHFAFQEPENDPRNFCYLWVGQGPMVDDNLDDYLSTISLFQLGFNQKNFYDSHGHLYEELASLGLRFEQYLSADPFNTDTSSRSRILACSAIFDPHFIPSANTHQNGDDSSTENSSGCQDISRSLILWETLNSAAEKKVFLMLFDINRWYHAQMPSCVRTLADGLSLCSYVSLYSLDNAVEASQVLNALVVHKNIHRFKSPLLPPPESIFFPSSLTFDASILTSSGTTHARFLSIQRQSLSTLISQGATSLLHPAKIYAVCVGCGLIPRVNEGSPLDVPVTVQREALLSMAADHSMVTFLTTVASQLLTSEYTAMGCSMRFLIEWAWKKVTHLKTTMDMLCDSLYNCSGTGIDDHSHQLLNHCATTLGHMLMLFKSLASSNAVVTENGHAELMAKLNVVQLVNEYASMVVLFLNLGYLPELCDGDAGEGCVYPSNALKNCYLSRRGKVRHLHSAIKCQDLLLVDATVDRAAQPIIELWKNNDHADVAGFPPSSFHSLLNMYLVDNVALDIKHFLTYYVLSDLHFLAKDPTRAEMAKRIEKFTQACRMKSSQKKLVHGMWLLDHADFQESLTYLLDPSLRLDIKPWQHTCIVKAFLYQGQANLALKYIRVVSPPMTTAEDVKLCLTVLLANGMTSEAFDYQRKCRDIVNAKDLLSHLVLASRQMRTVDQLLHLPFTEKEEDHLLSYLRDSTESTSQELLVVYFLQRARFIEAIQQNSKLKFAGDHDSSSRGRKKVRNSIVDGYMKVLPSVLRKLAQGEQTLKQRKALVRRHYARPTPLSTNVIKAAATQNMTRSALINTLMNKVHEASVMEEPELEVEDECRTLENIEPPSPGPFVCTPIINRTRNDVQESSAVVYPMAEISTAESTHVTKYMSPMRTKNASNHLLTKSLKKFNDSIAQEMKTLLCTPPVVRRKSILPRPSEDAVSTPTLAPVSQSNTPHSILKVKQTESPAVIPSIAKLKSTGDPIGDWLTPPMPEGMKAFMSLRMSTVAQSSGKKTPAEPSTPITSNSTPKLLRFAMGDTGDEGNGSEAADGEKDTEEMTSHEGMEEEDEQDEAVIRVEDPEEFNVIRVEDPEECMDEEPIPPSLTNVHANTSPSISSHSDLGLSPAALRALRGSVLLETIRLKHSASPQSSPIKLSDSLSSDHSSVHTHSPGTEVDVDDDITFNFGVDHSKRDKGDHCDLKLELESSDEEKDDEDKAADKEEEKVEKNEIKGIAEVAEKPELTIIERIAESEGNSDVEEMERDKETFPENNVEFEGEKAMMKEEIKEAEEPENTNICENVAVDVKENIAFEETVLHDDMELERKGAVMEDQVEEPKKNSVQVKENIAMKETVIESGDLEFAEEKVVMDEKEVENAEKEIDEQTEMKRVEKEDQEIKGAAVGEIASEYLNCEDNVRHVAVKDVSEMEAEEETSCYEDEVFGDAKKEDKDVPSLDEVDKAVDVHATSEDSQPRKEHRQLIVKEEPSQSLLLTPSHRRSTRLHSKESLSSEPIPSALKRKPLSQSTGRVNKLDTPAGRSSVTQSAKKAVKFLLPDLQESDEDGKSVLRPSAKSRLPSTPTDIDSEALSTPPMAPRTRRRTFEIQRTPSTSSVDSEASKVSLMKDKSVDVPTFKFSDPVIVDRLPEEADAMTTPVKSFIFSPPVTRSLSKRKSLGTPLKTPKKEAPSPAPAIQSVHRRSLGGTEALESPNPKRRFLTPQIPAESPARNTRSALKKMKEAQLNELTAPSDSPINFLTPVPEEDEVKGKAKLTKTVSRSSRRPTRPRRKTLKW